MKMADKAHEAISVVSRRYDVVLKDKQVEAILTFINGSDIFVTLPTGYGKSLIYALLPSVFDHYKEQQGSIVICVSPLVSLMMDQKSKFTPRGINTEFVGEEQTDDMAIKSVVSGAVQLVYISPESLMCNSMFRNMILSPVYKEKLVAFVVDEAHCVKTWGDKFRVVYAQLGNIRSLLPSSVNVMALTATATHATYKAVCCRLSLHNPIVIGCQPNRPNIKYEVKPLVSIDDLCGGISQGLRSLQLEYPKTVIFIQRYSDCALIYHTLRRMLGPNLTFPPHFPLSQKFSLVDIYTRASTIDKKEKVLSAFCQPNGTLRVIIATTAFGMGVDCADIRVVIHWGPPSNLEQYLQETGRAGRDGKPSKAILYFGKPGRLVEDDVKSYAQNSTTCRRETLLKNFMFSDINSLTQDNSKCCDVCTHNNNITI